MVLVMRIKNEQLIEGLPAPLARKLMRAYISENNISPTLEILGIGEEAARAVLSAFCRDGYLMAGSIPEQWVTTIKGNALVNASLSSIKRKTAQDRLQSLIERARIYNADPSKVRTVSQLLVFGSYLDARKQELSDLDVAVVITRRYVGDEFTDKDHEFTSSSGRAFSTYLQRLAWPEKDLTLFLKNRSSAISLTTEDISRFTDRYECVYKVEDDPQAIRLPSDELAGLERLEIL